MLAVTATDARGRGPRRRAALPAARRRGRRVPRLGDAAARAALAAQRHRRPPARGAAPARPPAATATRGRPGQVVVAPVRALLQPLVARARRPGAGARCAPATSVRPGRASSPAWSTSAYTRVDLVEKRGEFAVRGGILDVFPPTEEHPLRVEFWGDTVEEIRWFKVADQRSLEVAEHGLWAPPCRELLLTDEVRERAARAGRRAPRAGRRARTSSPRASRSRAWSRSRPVLVDGMELLLDVLPAGAHVVLCDPERVRTRAARPGRDQPGVPRGVAGRAAAGAAVDRAPSTSARRPTGARRRPRARARAPGRPWWTRHAVRAPTRSRRRGATSTPSRSRHARAELYRGDTDRARRRRARAGCATAGASWSSPRATARPSASPSVLARARTSPPGSTSTLPERARAAVVHVTTGPLEHGFVARGRGSRCSPRPTSSASESLHQGHAADAVAAPQRRRPAAAAGRRLRRARAARRRPLRRDGAAHRRRAPPASTSSSSTPPPSAASPPTGSSCPPTSSTRSPATSAARRPRCTGSAAPTGTKAKGRARKAVKQIAAELIQLYSRAAWPRPGTPSRPDTPWQRELEDAFPYVETPDQLAAHRRGQGATWSSRSRWTG